MHATINNARLVLSADELSELHGEGMTILYRLARDFRKRMEGYDADGTFGGFAAMFLPRKLGDAWHRMHPEHRHVTFADGSRKWVYGDRAVSLEAMVSDEPDRCDLLADGRRHADLHGRLRDALLARARQEHRWIVPTAVGLAGGQSMEAIAAVLGVSVEMVKRYRATAERCAPEGRGYASVQELRERLERQAIEDAELGAKVGELLGEGASVGDVARLLDVDQQAVRAQQDAIRGVWHAIESGEG